MKTEAYQRGDFGIAIAESYYKMDELLDTEEGQAELRVLAGAADAPTPPRGLFSHIEGTLDAPPPPTTTTNTTTITDVATTPVKKSAAPRLKKSDSTDEFRKSALMRHSVIPGMTSSGDCSMETLESGISSEFSAHSNDHDHDDDDENEDDENDEGGAEEHTATGMGCTAVSVLIHNNSVVVANTGDSRCVMSRRGEATPLTLDHKPIIFEEAQRIIRAGGFVRDNRVNGALNISRTIGDLDFKRNTELPHTEQMVIATPDITELELHEGDEFLVLACDGIWDVLSNQEAVDFVRKRIRQGQSLKQICEAMCDHCLAPDLKGLCRGADNMSVILILFRKHADLDSFWYQLWSNMMGVFKKSR